MDRPIAAGFDLFDTQQSTTTLYTYALASYGITFRMGFDWYQDLHDTVRYTVREDSINNVASTASIYIVEEEGNRLESIIGNTIQWDKRDNRLNPTSGYFAQLDVSFAGAGGNVRYVKPVVSGGYYYQFAPKWVLATTAEAGEVIGLGQPVNIQDRFFVGGDNLRGFAQGGVGPRDISTRDALGGDEYYVGSLTLQVPLGLPEELGIGGRVFTDFGSLFGIDQSGNIADPHSIRVSSGLGVSWKSPLGPIKIDFGLPVVLSRYDERQFVHVDFGTHF
jgi:outer membrane protein insertion porin family